MKCIYDEACYRKSFIKPQGGAYLILDTPVGDLKYKSGVGIIVHYSRDCTVVNTV